MGFILNIIALILYALVYIVDYFVTFFKYKGQRGYIKKVSKNHFDKAFRLDVFANLQYKDTWAIVFGRKGYQFGRFGETLSSVFGKKRADKSLTYFGYIITYILDLLWFTDWLKGGHCKASIMTEERIKEVKQLIINQE